MLIKLISPRMSLRPMDSEFKRRMSPSLAGQVDTLRNTPHSKIVRLLRNAEHFSQ